MNKRLLGKSDLEVPPIIFGAWAIGGWYWGGTNDKEAIRAIHASMDAGVATFDTAPVYGFGHSETILGKALVGRRNEAIICSKVGLRWDSEEGALVRKRVAPTAVVSHAKTTGSIGVTKQPVAPAAVVSSIFGRTTVWPLRFD